MNVTRITVKLNLLSLRSTLRKCCVLPGAAGVHLQVIQIIWLVLAVPSRQAKGKDGRELLFAQNTTIEAFALSKKAHSSGIGTGNSLWTEFLDRRLPIDCFCRLSRFTCKSEIDAQLVRGFGTLGA